MQSVLPRFINSESASGWLLLIGIVAALLLANSPLGVPYATILAADLGGTIGGVALRYTVQEWINDGLMAVFFLLLGLEVKRAFVAGELAGFRKASLPVFAALGGCIFPALCFALLNAQTTTAKGWAIPMATDIAFALAVLKMGAGNKAGTTRTFLSTLAIADDLCAIIVIALFYSGKIHTGYLLAALAVFGMQVGFNRLGITRLWMYCVPGLVLWYCIHHAGIHATIAGVLTAFTIPVAGKNGYAPLNRLEHLLLNPVNLIIVPLFVLANTNIRFEAAMLPELFSPLSAGILAGLLVGKPVGILLLSFVTVKSGIGSLPAGMRWTHVLGVGLVAGIGFTMSIFVALLSYGQAGLQAQAKATILLSSLVAGILGYLHFRRIRKAGAI